MQGSRQNTENNLFFLGMPLLKSNLSYCQRWCSTLPEWISEPEFSSKKSNRNDFTLDRDTLHIDPAECFQKRCNELEICLSPRWDLNPGLSLAQRIAKRTRYQSAKGELALSQGQRRSFEFEGYVIRERCHGNLLRAFAHLTVLTCELTRATLLHCYTATLTPLWLPLHFEFRSNLILFFIFFYSHLSESRHQCNELEICLSPRWDLNPGLSLAQRIAKRTRYQSAKGELALSQGQRRSFEFEGYVIRERCHGNLLRAFAHLTVLTCELTRATLLHCYRGTS